MCKLTKRIRSVLIPLLVIMLQACGSNDKQTEQQPIKPTAPLPSPEIIAPPVAKADFIGFESAPVRPIAKSADGKYLFVTNTPNNSVEIFQLSTNGHVNHIQSLPVGLEPVAVAINNNKAWVVNHLSDSISIINLNHNKAFIERTLLVGDEPRDIVFANGHAFITTAHRGQQRLNPNLQDVIGAGDPKLHTASQGRSDIWIFNNHDVGDGLGGKPVKILSLFGDTLRGLAVSPDKSRIYAGVLNSGNQTSAVYEAVMCYGFEDDEYGAFPCKVLDEQTSPNGLEDGYLPGGRTAPGINIDAEPQPWTSMIVKYDNQSGQWQDSKGRNFTNGIRFSLPDLDVFEINTKTFS